MAESALALREHPQIIELLSVLEQNSLSKQKEEVQALVGYIDGMEEKLSQMMEEMKAMRLEVEKLHDKGIRARCAQLVGTAEGKIRQGKPCFPRPGQTLSRLPGVCWGRFRKRGAPPCAMRCRRCVSPPSSPAWSAAFPTQARRWSNAPGNWI